MKTNHLIVDGMLSGTGIRDGINGGYIDLGDLDISANLASQITKWLTHYENVHFQVLRIMQKINDLIWWGCKSRVC